MKKSTVVKVLGAITLVAVLIAAVGAVVAARSYEDCASRIVKSAPPSDAQPPAAFRDLARAFWGNRDLYLARVLAQECSSDGQNGKRGPGSQLFAAGVVKTRLSFPERVTLSSILMPAPGGGRGLTRVAQSEWGRPPARLDESEMTWLFVVAQQPSCSRQRPGSDPDQQVCKDIYQGLLARRSQPSET